jgi:hypothetical protein
MSKKNKYDYLEQYINDQHIDNNCFYPLSLKDIETEENRLGFKFSYQLREFYLEIGYGFFIHTHDKKETQTVHANRLMDPTSVADIFLLGYESGQILPSVKFKPGYLPFFEVGDGANFLFLKPQSANPNTVYGSLGEVIEPEFEKFIWRLYYESPTYYMKNWGEKGLEKL